jgi:short-subunit dehydrogenase
VLVARGEAGLGRLAVELREQYGVTVRVIPFDLRRAVAPQWIYDELQREGMRVDVLVNNAGFIVYGPFWETDLARELEMIQVNLVATTALTKLFVRDMVRRHSGRILNIGSTGSFIPGPLSCVYNATKAYVLSFSEALSRELKDTGVTVTVLCPGATATGFQEAGNVEDIRLVRQGVQSANEVAEAGYRAVMAGRRVVVTGFGNRVQVAGSRIVPRAWLLTLTKMAMEKPGARR